MKSVVELFKALADINRLRILMILERKELCVCQIMAIVGLSQPLVSRNLSILMGVGLLDERREGKLRFYSIKKDLSGERRMIIQMVRRSLRDDPVYHQDIDAIKECTEFQKKTGRCDMNALREFMLWRQRSQKGKYTEAKGKVDM